MEKLKTYFNSRIIIHMQCIHDLLKVNIKPPCVHPFLAPGGMHNIQQHTFGLARYTYMLLSSVCHGNGRPVAQIYAEGQFESPSTQGAILNFNLKDSHGQIIGYSQVHSINRILFYFTTVQLLHI